MKKLALVLSILSAFPALANVTNSTQLYFGSKQPSQSCGAQGRLATVAEIEALKNNASLCNDVQSPWAIWKIQGEDGSLWSFMGYSYACETKADSNKSNQSVCVMDDVLENTAQMYSQSHYNGSYPWDGRAAISVVGDDVPNADIKSFKLGNGVKLTAYSASNYNGDSYVFTKSMDEVAFDIKSYKLDFIDSQNEYNFTFKSSTPYKSCLTININDLSKEVCTDSPSEAISLGNAPEKGQINIATFLKTYESSTPEWKPTGQVVLSVDENDHSLSVAHQSLPDGLTLNLNNRTLEFTYN